MHVVRQIYRITITTKFMPMITISGHHNEQYVNGPGLLKYAIILDSNVQ